MSKINVKYFNNEQSLTVFVDKAIAKRKSVSVQATERGYTVYYR